MKATRSNRYILVKEKNLLKTTWCVHLMQFWTKHQNSVHHCNVNKTDRHPFILLTIPNHLNTHRIVHCYLLSIQTAEKLPTFWMRWGWASENGSGTLSEWAGEKCGTDSVWWVVCKHECIFHVTPSTIGFIQLHYVYKKNGGANYKHTDKCTTIIIINIGGISFPLHWITIHPLNSFIHFFFPIFLGVESENEAEKKIVPRLMFIFGVVFWCRWIGRIKFTRMHAIHSHTPMYSVEKLRFMMLG